MDEQIDDGGPASPAHIDSNEGMSLRDWFAGMALSGYLANPDPEMDLVIEILAKHSYAIADAMLEARKEVGRGIVASAYSREPLSTSSHQDRKVHVGFAADRLSRRKLDRVLLAVCAKYYYLACVFRRAGK